MLVSAGGGISSAVESLETSDEGGSLYSHCNWVYAGIGGGDELSELVDGRVVTGWHGGGLVDRGRSRAMWI